MTNISYAQNYEDVMLLRALRGVERGFYIDVGAQDPVNDSVTKMFYQRGWQGINIEPVTHWYQRLLADRPHDINLQLAVSDKPGRLHLYEVEGSGLSTTDPEFAQRHQQAGFSIRESDVDCVTLDQICERHGVVDVQFLKIDCEGAEAAALRGISLERVRPWIILLEATEPNSQKPAYAEWEPLLTTRNYRFAYADGLNRFYVANERAELLEAFAYPPNVFDKFIRADEATAREQLLEVESRLTLATNAQQLTHLHLENERREMALVELRRVLEERDRALAETTETGRHNLEERDRSLALATEAGRQMHEERDHALAKAADAEQHSIEKITQLQNEIARLHHEVARRDNLINQLNAAVVAIQKSTSWRITFPLRAVRRLGRASYRVVRRGAYHLLRWPARLVRPLLRRTVQWAWLRSPAVAIAGHDSRIVAKARLFLFGAPPPVQVEGAILPEAPLTRSAIRVLEVIEQIRKQK
ncbi:MAG: FkbM family methyltransferase [Rhodanobacter sp.]